MSVIDDTDIIRTLQFLWNGFTNKNYTKVYSSSNEDLTAIFSQIDFSGKDVLTVLASGDQSFMFYNATAKKVDTFDINKLSFYYFYLRRWTIEYFDKLYFDGELKLDYIREMLRIVKPKSDQEQIAYYYWSKCINLLNDYDIKRMFYMGCFPLTTDFCDISVIKNRIQNESFNFYNVDISNDVDIKDKYDVIYVSNIVDYVRGVNALCTYRDNLYDLLKDNGIVICTSVGTTMVNNDIKVMFEERFEYHDIPKSFIYYNSPGHYYIKK